MRGTPGRYESEGTHDDSKEHVSHLYALRNRLAPDAIAWAWDCQPPSHDVTFLMTLPWINSKPQEGTMYSLARVAVLVSAIVVVGCAHQINITPPLNTLGAQDIVKIDKTVGYYISAADRSKEVETPGGGGDKVKYLPYQESEPALKQVLSNLFTKVVSIASLNDKQFIASNNVAYVFIPAIETNSSSESSFTWPPTKFTVTLDSRAVDPSGSTVWQKKVTGEGQATFSDFKQDMSLAARRASRNAFLNLQREISAAREFR
jgi:hypothetical protein